MVRDLLVGNAREAVLRVRIGLFKHDARDAAAQRMEKIILNVIKHRLHIARLGAAQELLHDRRLGTKRAQRDDVDIRKHGVTARLQDGHRVARPGAVERVEHAAAAADDGHERDLAAGIRGNKHAQSAGEHEEEAVSFRHGKHHVVPRAIGADNGIQAQHLLLGAGERIPERQTWRKIIGTLGFILLHVTHLCGICPYVTVTNTSA